MIWQGICGRSTSNVLELNSNEANVGKALAIGPANHKRWWLCRTSTATRFRLSLKEVFVLLVRSLAPAGINRFVSRTVHYAKIAEWHPNWKSAVTQPYLGTYFSPYKLLASRLFLQPHHLWTHFSPIRSQRAAFGRMNAPPGPSKSSVGR